jgi:hypothetical protein
MRINFDIVDNCAVNYEGRHIDLHNNFDFCGFDYNVVERVIRLNWKKSNGDWVDKDEFSDLVFMHKGVTFLKVIDQDEKSTYADDSCLDEITFFPSSERDLNDNILPQAKPNVNDDILYFFENGSRIRIHCEQIDLIVNVKPTVALTLPKNESLILFDFLARFNETNPQNVFEDQAEQKVLWLLEGHLEKQLVEPFQLDYKDIISEAKNQLRDEE